MRLAFLSSQPRSGSTLTQKILAAHSSVYTRSEPWVMLQPAYALKEDLPHLEYNSLWEKRASANFIASLPEGRKTYIEALSDMYGKLYGTYLKKESKTLFLDKTPRYYLIINELHDIFPDAKQILLLRNPLSVLRSIIKSWTGKDHKRLIDYKVDLYKAIEIFDDLVQKQPSWLYIMHYEKLLENAEEELLSLCQYLDIKYETNMLDYYQKPQEKWEFGDPKNVYAKKGIDSNNIAMLWLAQLKDPQLWRFFYDYLNFIGEERYGRFGYDFKTDMEYLKTNIPAENFETLLTTTFSLDSFLNPSDADREKNREEIQLMLRNNHKKILSLQEENEMLKNKTQGFLNELQAIKGSRKYRFAKRLGKMKSFFTESK